MNYYDVEEHYRKNYDYLVKRITGRVPDNSKALAEEVVQEAYTRVLKYLDKYNPDKSAFDTWFSSILNNCVNKCKGIERHRGAVKADEDEFNYIEEVEDFPLADRAFISGCIEKYDGDKKKILQLYYEEGLKSKDIAECLGKSDGAVRMFLCRFSKEMKGES